MNVLSDSPNLSPNSGGRPQLRLTGPLLLAMRGLWVAIAILSLGLFVLSIPYHGQHLSAELSPEAKTALLHMGRTVDFYTWVELSHVIVIALGYTLTALAIFIRRSDDWMTVFVSLAMLTFGVAIPPSPEMPPILFALVAHNAAFLIPVLFLFCLGLGSMLLIFYLFPDGCFVPRWTRPMAYIWLVWLLAFMLVPSASLTQGGVSPVVEFVLRLLSPDPQFFARLVETLRIYSLMLVLLFWFGSGIFAQIYRYLRVSSPLQQQQTKWAVYGFSAAFILYFGVYLFIRILVATGQSPDTILRYHLVTLPVSTVALLLLPLTLTVSILRFRLWEIDYLINRTLVYGTLTSFLAVVYFGSVLVIQALFNELSGYNSTLVIAITTLGVAALFRPMRERMQEIIDRRFYREKVNFRQAFTDFAREVRTILDLPVLLQMLVDRTAELLHIEYGAVYLHQPDQAFHLAHAHQLPDGDLQILPLTERQFDRLQSGQVVSQPQNKTFALLVPLIPPHRHTQERQVPLLSGVLALGPLRSGLHYSREDHALLLGLADQAGTAIYVAQLIQETQAEMERREEAEERLEAYRNSPLGRAETKAQEILSQPETAFAALHQVAALAGKDPDSASLLGNLSKALESLGGGPVAGLAEGYNYIFSSQFTNELMPIGLRTLIAALEDSVQLLPDVAPSEPDETDPQAPAAPDERTRLLGAITIYRMCQTAYDANSIAQITELRECLGAAAQEPAPIFMNDLSTKLAGLEKAIEALHAYERVDTSADKLSYLARAIHHLRHVDHLARTELGTADRPILQRIVESWMAIVTSAMGGIQTSARLVCQLLTRNTWQEDMISLVLQIQNQGKSAALKIKVNLNAAPEYTLLDSSVVIERLGPGEEAQVQLRVRPRLEDGADSFRARFFILYSDPRGPDQVENFADVVHILSAAGDFQFIPNPYVVGTPLQTGSPLFFGREDLVRFVQDNLAASHRNNLVLVGQRRTGKTSLLKQLPARLDDSHLPVYLDGQTLGLDPGLPNFFLTLATEISFALEDHGFLVEPPELRDFTDSPAATFERDFLARVRQAIGDRHLLIMFDEFEELEAAVERGNLETSIFGFLRHLIQHSPNLSVIFCGTHRIEELAADYWNTLFNISLYQHVAFLDKAEGLRLIQEPVASFGMRYDDLALDKMWRVTAGHPYFLQLLCHSLVNRHNKTGRNYVTIADVNAALDEILASGEAHFVYLWTESTSEERMALAALSRMVPLNGQAAAVQVLDYLTERGISIDRHTVSTALHHLTLRDILSVNREGEAEAGEAYRWKLGLLSLWVEKYKSLSRVVDEVVL